jgi:hypothetical protein
MENIRQPKNNEPRRYWFHHIMILLVFALVLGLAQNAWAIRGKIFITNKSGVIVEILIKKRSNAGLSYWKPMNTVNVGRTRILKGIPSGTTLGFRDKNNKSKTWPARKFVFRRGKDQQRLTINPLN